MNRLNTAANDAAPAGPAAYVATGLYSVALVNNPRTLAQALERYARNTSQPGLPLPLVLERMNRAARLGAMCS
jgi:hypothetical protein